MKFQFVDRGEDKQSIERSSTTLNNPITTACLQYFHPLLDNFSSLLVLFHLSCSLSFS